MITLKAIIKVKLQGSELRQVYLRMGSLLQLGVAVVQLMIAQRTLYREMAFLLLFLMFPYHCFSNIDAPVVCGEAQTLSGCATRQSVRS